MSLPVSFYSDGKVLIPFVWVHSQWSATLIERTSMTFHTSFGRLGYTALQRNSLLFFSNDRLNFILHRSKGQPGIFFVIFMSLRIKLISFSLQGSISQGCIRVSNLNPTKLSEMINTLCNQAIEHREFIFIIIIISIIIITIIIIIIIVRVIQYFMTFKYPAKVLLALSVVRNVACFDWELTMNK